MDSFVKKEPINILINLKSNLISEALKSLLSLKTGQFKTKTSLKESQSFSPHKILVDIHTLSEGLQHRWPDAKIILIDTGLAEEDIISCFTSHKIYGIIATDTTPDYFYKALDAISNGEVWIDNRKMKVLLHSQETLQRVGTKESLSRKEREIVMLVSQGLRNKEIADRLCISDQTVKAHISRIFRKYKVSSRAQLVPLALKYYPPMP